MKIGIIGSGGSGMCAAWLLGEDHEITLLEKRDYLGGHTHTVDVDLNGTTHHIDDGASWFSPIIFPYFNKYIELAGVQYDWIPLSLTYYDSLRSTTNCMPPVKGYDFFRIFTTSNTLPELLTLNKILKAAAPIVKERNSGLTYEQFIKGLGISGDMEKDFIKPLIAGLWGLPLDHVDGTSIYPLLNYLVYHKPSAFKYFKWKIMTGGTGQYIRTIEDRLKNTSIYMTQEVVAVIPNPDTKKVTVKTGNGQALEFDHLIITAGAHDACKFIKETREVKMALQGFAYYKATLCVHSDTSFMPPKRRDWAVVNVINKGTHADTTIWHGWEKKADIFCSYVHQNNFPQCIHHISEWWLPLETPSHFEAQKRLLSVQGSNNTWFAGDYTTNTGSHEDAIQSAIRIVEVICPNSKRLKLLKTAVG